MEAELRDARARIETTLSAGEVATWTYNLQEDAVIADKNMARLFSVSPQDAAGGPIAAYIRAMHPEDRARVEATIKPLSKAGATTKRSIASCSRTPASAG